MPCKKSLYFGIFENGENIPDMMYDKKRNNNTRIQGESREEIDDNSYYAGNSFFCLAILEILEGIQSGWTTKRENTENREKVTYTSKKKGKRKKQMPRLPKRRNENTRNP